MRHHFLSFWKGKSAKKYKQAGAICNVVENPDAMDANYLRTVALIIKKRKARRQLLLWTLFNELNTPRELWVHPLCQYRDSEGELETIWQRILIDEDKFFDYL